MTYQEYHDLSVRILKHQNDAYRAEGFSIRWRYWLNRWHHLYILYNKQSDKYL